VGYGFEGHGPADQLTGYYRRNRDTATDVTEYLGNGVSLTTKANLPKADSAGLEFTSNGQILPKLSYSLSGNLFYSQIDATALGAPGLKSTTGVNAKLKLDYRPTPKDSAQVAVTRTDKRLTPQGYVSAINVVNVGYKRQIKPDLTAGELSGRVVILFQKIYDLLPDRRVGETAVRFHVVVWNDGLGVLDPAIQRRLVPRHP
jgi:outer membrane receptor protein involved in Fe transport